MKILLLSFQINLGTAKSVFALLQVVAAAALFAGLATYIPVQPSGLTLLASLAVACVALIMTHRVGFAIFRVLDYVQHHSLSRAYVFLAAAIASAIGLLWMPVLLLQALGVSLALTIVWAFSIAWMLDA